MLSGLVEPAVTGHRPQRRSRRDWIVDTVMFLLAIGIGLLSTGLPGPVAPLLPVAPQWMNLAVAALACTALWTRRRRAVTLSLTSSVASLFFPAAGGASVIALFTVAAHRATAYTVVCTAVAVITAFAQYWIYPAQPLTGTTYWVAVGFTATLSVLAAAWGTIVRTRRQLFQSLVERAKRAEAEQALRVEQGRRRERERIARDMHDALGHRLSLLSLHAGALEYRDDMSLDEVSQAAAVIRTSAKRCMADLRGIIRVLRSVDEAGGPARQPGLDDLPQLFEENRQAGMELDLCGTGVDTGALSDVTGAHAYRIIQEGLTNARRHAAGQPVRLWLTVDTADGVVIELINRRNRGRTTTGEGSGLGLVGLTERVALAGGRIEHGVTAAGLFRLWAWIPAVPGTEPALRDGADPVAHE